MDIAYSIIILVFLIANSLFFYYKGYTRAKKDNKTIANFSGKLTTIIDDSIARGVFFALENMESYEMIASEIEERGIDTVDGPRILKRYYTSIENDFTLSFDFLYNPNTNTYKLLADDDEEIE